MRSIFTLMLSGLLTVGLFGQYPVVQPSDINDATQAQLSNCNDTSSYYLDTVTVVCYVITDGSLCEVESSSINGANGIRPFIWVNDTASNGQVGPNTGLEVMGVNWQTSQATSGFTSYLAGDILEITGVVGMFDNATQFQPLNNNSITLIGTNNSPITPVQLSVGDLNDQNQVNNLVTGEQWQSVYAEFKNVTVTTVNQFGSGTGARIEFTVADSAGNSMQVYDFFVAQKLNSWTTQNPNSPYSNGIFSPPSVGTFYNSLKGVIEHSGNGCTGSGGQGYRLHPFDSSHYDVGQAFPSFTSVSNDPSVPTSSDSITISADIIDPDGSIDSAHIFWSNDTSLPVSAYTKATMTIGSGGLYNHKIGPQSNNTIISYYIRAVDNNTNVSYYPATPAGQTNNLALIYVRDGGLSIADVQTPLSGGGDASPFEGQRVTIRGFVTAGVRDCDLGFVYIQDTSSSEYSAIGLRGSLNLANLYRNEYVEASGLIEESFGYTQMQIDSVKSLGSSYEVQPMVLDPGDAAQLAEYEKYESMLVKYENTSGGQLQVTDEDLGFGEYAISSNPNPATNDEQRRVLAGRQAGSNAQSSLYVQLVSDSSYATQDGQMFYSPIEANTSMTMDGITGILWYSFGTYKVTPRNNFDIENLSVSLDTSGCNTPIFDIEEIGQSAQFSIYPNPAANYLTIEGSSQEFNVEVYDLKGSLVARQQSGKTEKMRLNVSGLQNGFYIVKVIDENRNTGTYKVVVNK